MSDNPKKKKPPSKFLEFTKTNHDNGHLIEFIIAENLIECVTYNGVNCVEVRFKNGSTYSIIKDAKGCYERLKEAVSPSKIN